MSLVITLIRVRYNLSTSFFKKLTQDPIREQKTVSPKVNSNRVNKKFVQIHRLQNMKIPIISLSTIHGKLRNKN